MSAPADLIAPATSPTGRLNGLGNMALVPERRRITSQQYQELAQQAALLMSDGQSDAMSVRLFFALFRVGNRLSKDFEVAIRQTSGLSFAGYQLLFTLRAVGSINPNLLARLAGVSTASMSSLLNTMERKGLISRSADPEDGRRTIVDLTDSGDALVSTLYLENMDREQAWSEALTREEAEMLSELLRKLLAHKPRAYGPSAPSGAYWQQDEID